MKKEDYFKILKKTWDICWKNKFLWVFGLLMFIGSNTTNVFFDPEKNNRSDFFSNWPIFLTVMLIIFFVLIFLSLIYLGFSAKAALIKSVNDIPVYRETKILSAIKEGKTFFWRLLSIELTATFLAIFIFLVLFVPPLILLYIKSYFLFAFLVAGALIIAVPLLVMILFIKEYSILYAVVGNMKFYASLIDGYLLFKNNIKKSLLFVFWLFVAIIGASLAFVFSMMLLGMFIMAISFLFDFIFSGSGVLDIFEGIILIIGGLIGIFFGALVSTYEQSAWVVFFKEIAGKKTEKDNKELEKVSHTEIVPEGV